MSQLAQQVWRRYTQGRSLQVRAVARFEHLALEAKPSVYENTDPARWRQMEQQVKRLAGQEIRTEVMVQRPNRLFLEERSAFGWFRSVCDGRTWQAQLQDGEVIKTPAPGTLSQMAEARYHRWLGLEEPNMTDVLRLLAIGSPRLGKKLVAAKEHAADAPRRRKLVWSEPVTYEGLRGQGTITCLVDAQTGFIHHIEYRYLVAFDKDAWLNIAIGERWDNSRLSKPPPSTRFRFEQVRGATRR